MKLLGLSLTSALALCLCVGCASPQRVVVELPRPNSGTFTFAQAEARKSEILLLARSGQKSDWKNPYMGFCVHIARDEQIVVYNDKWPYGEKGGRMSFSQFETFLNDYSGPQAGNPLGVLITCEHDPRTSTTLSRVVKLLFKPSVQIFYLRRQTTSREMVYPPPSPRPSPVGLERESISSPRTFDRRG